MTAEAKNRQQHRHRQGLLFFAALSTCFFVGAALSWGPMQLMLEGNGSYSNECETTQSTGKDGGQNVSSVCPNQTAKLVMIGLLIPTAQILSPLLGLFVDKFGPRRTAQLQGTALLTGLGLLLLSVSNPTVPGMDPLLYSGFGLVAVHTWFGRLLIVQLGLYFTGHTTARVIFILNSLFDTGAVTYLALWGIQKVLGADMEAIMGGYLIFAVLVSSGAVYFWTVAEPIDNEVATETLYDILDRSKHSIFFEVSGRKEVTTESLHELLDQSKHSIFVDPFGTSNKKEEGIAGQSNCMSVVEDGMQRDLGSQKEGYVVVAERARCEQLKSPHFLLLCAIFGLHVSMNNWNIMTQRDFLASLGDNDHGNMYLSVFVLMTPISIIGAPFIDLIILKLGWMAAFHTINLLGLGYTLIKVASTNLSVQVVGFCIFSFYRSFLFGISFSFLPTLVAGKILGVASGTMAGLAGFTNLFLIPLVNVAVKQSDNNFLLPNTIMVILIVPATFLVFMLQKQMSLEKESKDLNHGFPNKAAAPQGASLSANGSASSDLSENALNGSTFEVEV